MHTHPDKIYFFSVYVFLGEHNGMIDMLTNLEERGLFDTGEYMLIHTDDKTLDMNQPLKYFQSKNHHVVLRLAIIYS